MLKKRKAKLLLDDLLVEMETKAAKRQFLLRYFIPYIWSLLVEAVRQVVDWRGE